ISSAQVFSLCAARRRTGRSRTGCSSLCAAATGLCGAGRGSMLHRTIITVMLVTVVAGVMLAGAMADGVTVEGGTVDGGTITGNAGLFGVRRITRRAAL
ncbi:MAG: hypothetical protein WCB20_01975, partial [Chthoniobacterales bacterium]